MVLIDTSVWVDYFNGAPSRQTGQLDELLLKGPVAIGDLILAEVLQGFRLERDYRRARSLLLDLPFEVLGGRDIALKAADNYRALRHHGVTVRKTIDVIIATACIVKGFTLLHDDRDFDPMERWLGLIVVR